MTVYNAPNRITTTEISHPKPTLYFAEIDKTTPTGRFRLTVEDGVMRLDRADEATWETYTTLFSVPASGSYLTTRTGGAATIVVAASDAPAHVKAQADLVCGDGTYDTDDEYIQAAFDLTTSYSSLYSFGHLSVELTAGTFTLANPLVPTGVITFKGQGIRRTVLTTETSGLASLVHLTGGMGNFDMSDMHLDGADLADKCLYPENAARCFFRNITIRRAVSWGLDIKYNHSFFFRDIVVNENGASSTTGGIRIGAASSPANVVHFDGLILEENGVGILDQSGIGHTFRNVNAESNQYQAFKCYADTASGDRPVNVLLDGWYMENNNASNTAGVNDIDIENGILVEVRNYNENSDNTTYAISVKSTSPGGSRYFKLGAGNGAVSIDCVEAFIENVSANNVTTGTSAQRITNAHRVISVELDLSGAAVDNDTIFFPQAARLINYNISYTEASSADTGVAIRIGRYQSGVALDDDYFDTVTSETSKAMGYVKNYYGASFTNQAVTAGDTLTVGTAGGKVGDGKVRVTIEYIDSG